MLRFDRIYERVGLMLAIEFANMIRAKELAVRFRKTQTRSDCDPVAKSKPSVVSAALQNRSLGI